MAKGFLIGGGILTAIGSVLILYGYNLYITSYYSISRLVGMVIIIIGIVIVVIGVLLVIIHIIIQFASREDDYDITYPRCYTPRTPLKLRDTPTHCVMMVRCPKCHRTDTIIVPLDEREQWTE